MTQNFTYEQIQNLTCKLCMLNGGNCLFSDEKRNQMFQENIPCTPIEKDENGNPTEEYVEIIEACKWLYNPTQSERLDYFVIDENYYNSLKK